MFCFIMKLILNKTIYILYLAIYIYIYCQIQYLTYIYIYVRLTFRGQFSSDNLFQDFLSVKNLLP